MRRPSILALLIAATIGVALVAAPAAGAAPGQVRAAGGEPAELLVMINADRAAAGLAPLAWRDDVAAIALTWSSTMAATGTLAHNDAYFSAATQQLIGSITRGENVAFNGSMEATHYAFMRSPGHRANILDPRFTAVGIAVVHDANDTSWVTEDFLQESGARVAQPEPPAAAAPPADPEPVAEPPQSPSPPTTVVTAPVEEVTTTTVPTTAPTTTSTTTAPVVVAALRTAPAATYGASDDSSTSTLVLLFSAVLISLDLAALRFVRRVRGAAPVQP